MSLVESIPNWQWFGSLSSEELHKQLSDNPSIEWLAKAITWKENRSAEGPPEHYVPVLTVNANGGQLGFLTVDEKQTYGEKSEPSEFEKYAYAAAIFVFDLFKPFQHTLGSPLVTIYLAENGGGSSLSLPAMIAALQRLTESRLPDTVCATGCFDGKNLFPVEGLPAKIDAAYRFGYKKILLVEGQKDIPDNCSLEVVFVNPDPNVAVFQLLNPKLAGATPRDRHLARLLYSADRLAKLRDTKIVESFLESNSQLVRSVACDILSRNALHQGNTNDAEKYHKQMETLPWHKIPEGYLGHYLRYEWIAATAVLEIDLGILDDNYETHTELDKRLEHLQRAIANGFADRSDYFSALTLANTRALRKQFAARLQKDEDARLFLLQSAWNDLIFLFDDWQEIFKYAERIDRRSTLRRQRNYCLECLMDYWKIFKQLPLWEKVDDFLTFAKRVKYEDAFDKIAELNYHKITNKPFSDNNLQHLITKFDSFNVAEHPNWIFYENILRFGLGSKAQREHCLSKLTAVLPELMKDNTSIFIVLALRTRQILLDNGVSEGELSPCVVPPENTPLRKIYDDLISSRKCCVDRCPY